MRRSFQTFLFWLACSAWTVTGFAQSGQILEIHSFAETPELSGIDIYDIWQDKVGYLWVATKEGLLRYDGYTFKPFRNVPGDSTTIGYNQALQILEDKNGDLWLALARGGISRYDRATGRFRNYPFTRKMNPSNASVTGLYFDRKGQLWAGVSMNGIVRLDVETGDFEQYDLLTVENSPHLNAENIPAENVGYRFFEDETGKLWVSTHNECYIFDPETGTAKPWRPMKKLPPDAIFANHSFSLLPEGDLLWVGGWESGLRRIDRKTGACRQFMFYPDNKPRFYANIVNDFIIKSPDEFWIASQEKGIGIFNKKTEQFYWFSDHPEQVVGIPPPVAAGVMTQDNQGNLWTVADRKLVRFKMKDNPFKPHNIKVKKKTEFTVTQILEDREGKFLFIGTQYADGLHVIDKKTGKEQALKFWTTSEENSALLVMDLLQARDGTIWVLTHHSVLRFNPLSRQLETPVQPPLYIKGGLSNYYTEFTEDPLGNLWLGTTHLGIIRYDAHTGQCTQFMPDKNDPHSIATNVVGSVEVDGKGRTWFGSRNQTAYGYYLPDEQRFEYLDAAGQVTQERSTLRMNSFFAAKNGDIWACTEQGILHFDCSGHRPQLRKKYTAADGLPNPYVMQGVEDMHGNFWAITHKLVRIDKNSGKITSFTEKNGYAPPIYRLKVGLDNLLYLPAKSKYFTFNPDSLISLETVVPIALTSFKIDDTERYEGSELMPTQGLDVPPDSRYFSIEFAALDLANAEERVYEYRLQDFDNQWIKCRDNRIVNFTNIPAGRYLFQVKLEGRPDSEALAVPITVRVVFYKTMWFWALVFTLFAGMTIAYFRNRQKQKEQVADLLGKAQLLEKEKALVQYESLKQQLNPHFLFNSLTSLSSLITIDPKAAIVFLDSLSKTYRYILKSSEQETVPLSEELKFVESFVKLQKTRFGEGLQVQFKISEDDFHRKIVPVTLQNLIENAIKHNIIDEDDPLVIEVFVEDGYLVVQNNLQKKTFVETSNKRGLSNLKSFYKYLSDKEIAVVEDGMKFTIKIPLL